MSNDQTIGLALEALRMALPLLPYAAKIDRAPGDLADVDEACEAVAAAIRALSQAS